MCLQVKREICAQYIYFNRQPNALLATLKQKCAIENGGLQTKL